MSNQTKLELNQHQQQTQQNTSEVSKDMQMLFGFFNKNIVMLKNMYIQHRLSEGKGLLSLCQYLWCEQTRHSFGRVVFHRPVHWHNMGLAPHPAVMEKGPDLYPDPAPYFRSLACTPLVRRDTAQALGPAP